MKAPFVLRKVNLPRTHCQRGHEMAGDNVASFKYGKYTHRQCKTCRKAAMAAYGIKRKIERILGPGKA